jgi:hypothetical protein
MALFGKKKERYPGTPPEAPARPGEGIPTALVIQMRSQGISNNQIVQSLQREGYSSSQIFDAMSQADIKGIVEQPEEGMPAEAGPAPAMPPPMPEQGQPFAPAPARKKPFLVPPPEMPPVSESPGAVSKEDVEEIAETIIDEKWEELMKSVDKIIAWKETIEQRFAKIEQKSKDLKEEFDALHKGVLGKIEDYDKSIKDVGTDIKAMEEVFKKTLPTFTENIHELSRLTRHIKSKKKKKSEKSV